VVDYPELSFTEFNQTLESWPGESCAAQEAETVARAAGLRTLTRPEYLRMIEALSEPFEGAIPVAQQYPEIERSKFNKENLTTWLLTAQQQDPLFKKPAWALPTDREELYQFSEMLRHPPYVNLYDKTTLRDIFWAVKRVAFPEFINCWPAQYSEIEQKEMVAYADMCQNLQKAARLYFVSRTSISRWRNDLKACRAVSATRYAALL
jgi:hypothetical protein